MFWGFYSKNGYWNHIQQGNSSVVFVKNEFTFLKWKKCKCADNWKKIKNELSTLSFGQNIGKILNRKINICATFRRKNGLNKMHKFIVS
jgi:hypothetical protein